MDLYCVKIIRDLFLNNLYEHEIHRIFKNRPMTYVKANKKMRTVLLLRLAFHLLTLLLIFGAIH